jgi:hypothetical protein
MLFVKMDHFFIPVINNFIDFPKVLGMVVLDFWDRLNGFEVLDYLRDNDLITVTRNGSFSSLFKRYTLGVAVNEFDLRLAEALYICRGAPRMIS